MNGHSNCHSSPLQNSQSNSDPRSSFGLLDSSSSSSNVGTFHQQIAAPPQAPYGTLLIQTNESHSRTSPSQPESNSHYSNFAASSVQSEPPLGSSNSVVTNSGRPSVGHQILISSQPSSVAHQLLRYSENQNPNTIQISNSSLHRPDAASESAILQAFVNGSLLQQSSSTGAQQVAPSVTSHRLPNTASNSGQYYVATSATGTNPSLLNLSSSVPAVHHANVSSNSVMIKQELLSQPHLTYTNAVEMSSGSNNEQQTSVIAGLVPLQIGQMTNNGSFVAIPAHHLQVLPGTPPRIRSGSVPPVVNQGDASLSPTRT